MPVRCPQCSTDNPDATNACVKCGASLAPEPANAKGAAPAESAPARRGKPVRRPPSRFAFGFFRLAAVLLLAAFLAAQLRVVLLQRELQNTGQQLERARGTIQHAVTTGGQYLLRMHAVPPDGEPVKLDLKLAACTVEEISFRGRDVSLRISNPGAQATKPRVRVMLFDADGTQVGETNVVDFRTTSFQPQETRVLSDRVSLSGDVPSYFLVDEGG